MLSACRRYGSRASSTYAALIKQSLAGVRRAEALEIARGVASSRNRQRDARIASIRENRIGMEVSRSEQARQVRVHMCCWLWLLCLLALALRLLALALRLLLLTCSGLWSVLSARTHSPTCAHARTHARMPAHTNTHRHNQGGGSPYRPPPA